MHQLLKEPFKLRVRCGFFLSAMTSTSAVTFISGPSGGRYLQQLLRDGKQFCPSTQPTHLPLYLQRQRMLPDLLLIATRALYKHGDRIQPQEPGDRWGRSCDPQSPLQLQHSQPCTAAIPCPSLPPSPVLPSQDPEETLLSQSIRNKVVLMAGQ